jgi:mannose-6-phosphate isomerase-like protein (cupin superfamily)
MIQGLEDAPWSQHPVLGMSNRALRFLIPHEATGGVVDWAWERMGRGGYAAEHAHPWRQMFFILKGQVRVVLDGEERIVGPNTAVYMAPNVMHGVWQVGDEEVERLVVTVHTSDDPPGTVAWKDPKENPDFQKG